MAAMIATSERKLTSAGYAAPLELRMNPVDFNATQTRQQIRHTAMNQMAAIELGGDMDCQRQLASCCLDTLRIG